MERQSLIEEAWAAPAKGEQHASAMLTRRWGQVFQAALLLGLCLVFVLRFMRWMWSQSVDLALHFALSTRLAEFWSLPAVYDPTLDDLNFYPRLSHSLAAIVGSVFGSALIGMQLVTLISLVVIWSAVAYLVFSLPRYFALVASAVLIAGLLLNKTVVHLELYGTEVISNFFYPQLVAQALAVLAVVVVIYAEKYGVQPAFRYLILVAFILVVNKTHLVPTVVLLGLLTALVACELIAGWASGRERVFVNGATCAGNGATGARGFRALGWNAVAGLLLIVVTIAIVIFDPLFKAMAANAKNNGSLPLTYVSSMKGLAILCVIVAISSAAVVYKWAKFGGAEERQGFAALKYVGLYGLSAAGICLLQIAALKLGHGSEYAAKKYAFSLHTVLLLECALMLPVLLVRKGAAARQAGRDDRNAIDCVLPVLLTFLSLLCTVPLRGRALDTAKAVSLERQIRLLRGTVIPRNPGKYDYAVNLENGSPTIDYMMSIGVLEAPRLGNAFEILRGRQLNDLSNVGTIVTSEHRQPYDVAACRRFVSATGLVLLDGDCLRKSLANSLPLCQGTIDFSGWLGGESVAGFSHAEGFGRWTEGTRASFTCALAAAARRPSLVRISTQGFVSGSHAQRVVIAINGGRPSEHHYDAYTPESVIELPVPADSTREIKISWSLPEAVSPKELGLSADDRKLGIGVRSVEFK
jgi:hypothetical protein